MARRTAGQLNRYPRGAVNGSAAYDFDYLERQYENAHRRAEDERRAEAERRREIERVREARRRAEAQAKRQQERREHAQARPRQRISPLIALGFVALAGVLFMLLTQYVQLSAISDEVVHLRSELSDLQDEHVTLLTRYEQTFDTATIKNAAERAGMTKPSGSQIYYMSLSEPDYVTIYESSETGVLARMFTSLGRGICAAVEYFR